MNISSALFPLKRVTDSPAISGHCATASFKGKSIRSCFDTQRAPHRRSVIQHFAMYLKDIDYDDKNIARVLTTGDGIRCEFPRILGNLPFPSRNSRCASGFRLLSDEAQPADNRKLVANPHANRQRRNSNGNHRDIATERCADKMKSS